MTSLNRRKARLALIMMLMFSLGTVTGVGCSVMGLSHLITRTHTMPEVVVKQRLMARALDRELDLNVEERLAVDDALHLQRPALDAHLRAKEVELTLLRRALVDTLRPSLRDHNKERLDAYLLRIETRQSRRYEPPIPMSPR